jgi:hypothetical protein
MMMKNKNLILFSWLLFSCLALEAKNESILLGKESPRKIAVDHKILAKVNDKVISTVDVMKKMDMLFYQQFPQYVNSVDARYQFYQANWKYVLEEFVNKELILADAAESKIEVSSGDVRQKMELYFGPDIITNLDKVGLTFEEASKMVLDEIIIRQMLMYRVNSKAIRLITPALVRKYYETFSQDEKNSQKPRWDYQVITIRGPVDEMNLTVANEAYQLLTAHQATSSDVSDKLTQSKFLREPTKLSISEVFQHHESDMSEAYRDIVKGLTPEAYSNPIAQTSRTDKSTVYRIFYLVKREEGGVPAFKEVEAKIREKLTNEAADQETTEYMKKLRKHYHLEESDLNALVPADYQPFTLTSSSS